MGSKKVSLPDTPSFQADPNYGWSQELLKSKANYLLNGLEGSGLTGLMADTVNISPEVSRLSMQLAQSQLDPAFRVRQQDMMNQLEANNQLTGSTTASSLENLNADYMASLTGMQAQYGLADVQRALQNRVSLYGTGLNTAQAVGSAGLENQQQMNQFALSNYENQVSAALLGQKSGSAWGQIGGAAIGGLAGFALGGPAGAMMGAGMGGGLGGALTGGGNAGMSTALGGLAMGGGYMAGSKYSPQGQIYTRGLESTQVSGANSNPYYSPLTYASTGR